MFVPQEDHFPGEFHNVYLIELKVKIPDLPFKVAEAFEVMGYDLDYFVWKEKGKEIQIPKTKTKILKKMIKRIR